jgi:hypothetical protein
VKETKGEIEREKLTIHARWRERPIGQKLRRARASDPD